jgi:antitoxin YefM
MGETFYLLKSPKNATRLLKSIEDYEKGFRQERSLIEDGG